MKSRFLMCFTAIALFAALAIPLQLTAQGNQDNHKHHHYKLIDLGTFGGPQSRIDYTIPLNSRGRVSGSADTTNTNPYYGNDNPTFFADPYIEHAFQWKNGMLIDLGSLPGGGTSLPNCINQSGDVAGNASNNVIDPIGGWPESMAVLYKDGEIKDLGTLDGGSESAATCLSDHDVVVGFAGDTTLDQFSLSGWGTQTHAFRWTKSRGLQDLKTLGGNDAIPTAVNNAGQIAGFSYTNSTPNPITGIPTLHPFLWEGGSMADLGTLGGTVGTNGDGGSLNRSGQVVGQSNLKGDVYAHPFLWTNPGPMQDLGTLGGNFGGAVWINDAGEVVGWATNAGDQASLAFRWKDGKMTNLGTVDGDQCSIAVHVNSKEQIVGASSACGAGGVHAFLWENDGPMVDLNTLVSHGSGLQLTGATSINERGEITTFGVLSNGDTRTILLIPCDKHHPSVEGCDYSLADAIPALRVNTVSRDVSRGAQRLSLESRTNRFRVPGFAIDPRN
jgi:probable HAF family extracellular repeat protein